MKLFHSNLSSPQLARIKLPTSIIELGGEDTDQGTSQTLTQSKKNLKEDNKARDRTTVTADSLLFPNLTLTVPLTSPPPHQPINQTEYRDIWWKARDMSQAVSDTKVPEVRPNLQLICK